MRSKKKCGCNVICMSARTYKSRLVCQLSQADGIKHVIDMLSLVFCRQRAWLAQAYARSKACCADPRFLSTASETNARPDMPNVHSWNVETH